MRLSRPAFYSAFASCFAHGVALGFAATLIVGAPQGPSRPVQVTLLQRALPLPIGEGNTTEKPAVIPSEKFAAPPPRAQTQPQPKPKPAAQSRRQRPPPRKIVRTPPSAPTPPTPPPAIVRPFQPQEESLQVTALNPTGTSDSERGGSPPLPSGTVTEQEGATTAGKTSGGAKVGPGQGGKAGLSVQPNYGVNPKPPYPILARRLGVQGIVLLRVQVRADGSVATVELARSSGFSMLDDSAARTVRESWRFVPARIDGAPVVSWVEVPIRFVLEDS